MPSPLRVLYLTDNPNLGASSRTLLDWISKQQREGIEFYLAVSRRGPLVRWLEEHRVPFVLTEMPWPDWRRPFSSIGPLARLAAKARRWRIDLVHAEHNVYPFAAPVARLIGAPAICHVHYLVGRGFATWMFTGWRRPQRVLWTTRTQQEECAAALDGVLQPDDQAVIPLGVDTESFGVNPGVRESVRRGWGIVDGTLVIGAANAIRPRKRVADFIHLVEKIVTTHPAPVVGIIAGSAPPGDEDYEAEMRRLHDRTALGSRLIWLGDVEAIEPFMHAIDLFVSTSGHETFGMSICEAMACGTPVAVYRGGSAAEVVGDAGIVVETGDLSGLTTSVGRLLARQGELLEAGRNARRRVVSTFDAKRSLSQVAQLYRSLVPPSD